LKISDKFSQSLQNSNKLVLKNSIPNAKINIDL